MRTALLILSFVFMGGVLNAQITKGSALIGGNLSFGSSKGEFDNLPNKTKSSSFSFQPSFGVAVKENLIVGVKLGYGNQTSSVTNIPAATKQKNNTYSAGAFIRKYKQLGKSDFYLFGDAGVNYYNRKTTSWNEGVETSARKENQIAIGITPGVSYAVNKRLHLELSVGDLFSAGFSTWKETNPSGPAYKNNSTYVSTNLSNITNSLSFGLRFLLAKA